MTRDAVDLVDVVRSGFVECVHRGSVVAIDAAGDPVVDIGRTGTAIFPRSSNKPLQAVGMLRAGLDLDGADLAIAAASHGGESMHVEHATRLLRHAGLGVDALTCPADLPLNESARADVLRAGGAPARITMNCSGKHAAMLLTCVVNGWPTASYAEADHPLQKEIRGAVEDLTGERVTAVGIDGCGAPIFAASLRGLAAAFRRLVTADPGTPARRVADAMRAHPLLVAGTGREDTRLMQAVPGLLVKGGAEGVHAAALANGAAVACKIEDGAARARVPVLLAALRRLGVPADSLPDLCERLLGGGRRVGEVRLASSALNQPPS